jgi:hypothetical protein
MKKSIKQSEKSFQHARLSDKQSMFEIKSDTGKLFKLCNLGWDKSTKILTGRRGRDLIVVGFTTTYAVSAYHHTSCGFDSRSWRGALDTTLCDEVYQ